MKSLKPVIQLSHCLEIKSCIKKFIITCYDFTSFYSSMFCLNKGSVRGGDGSNVARLNFKTSHVGVYKCFRSLSEIEPKFFVFVRILEKGDIAMRWEETIYSSAISQLTFRISNIYTSPFTIHTIHRRIHWSSTDKRRSLKHKENWRKLPVLLLGIQTGDKLFPNHRSFLLIPGFAVTVAISLRGLSLVTFSFYPL